MTSIKVEYTDNYRQIEITINKDQTYYAEYGVKKDGSLKDLDGDFNEDINNIFESLIGQCLTDNSCYDISLKIMKCVPFHDKVKMIFDEYKRRVEGILSNINYLINYPDISDLRMEGNTLKDLQRLTFLCDNYVWSNYSGNGYYKLNEQLRGINISERDYDNYIFTYNRNMRKLGNYTETLFDIIVYSFLL